MLSSTFRRFVDFSPKLSIKLWLFFYEIAALRFRNMEEWKYMNYGFSVPGENANESLNVLSENLYNYLFDKAVLKDKDVLEVGSGRGGGCQLVLQRNPKSVIGLDFSKNVTRFCQKYIQDPKLSFVQGNAEALHFPNESFDVILNLESSHCYGDRITFFNGVFNKLKPEGFFLYADFIGTIHFSKRLKQLMNCGFEIISSDDISQNVLHAMDLSAPYKEAIINKKVPKLFRKSIHDFVGLPGSDIYNNFAKGQTTYFVIICRKPNR